MDQEAKDISLSAEAAAAILSALDKWQRIGSPLTFKKAVDALQAGTIHHAVTKRGTNRMYTVNGEIRFDYLARTGQEKEWMPCDDHEPTDDDMAAIWIPVYKGEAQD